MLSTPLCGCARTDENVLIIIAELTSRLSTLPTLDTYRVSLNNASVVGWDSLESMMPPSFSTIGVIGDAMEIYQYLRSCQRAPTSATELPSRDKEFDIHLQTISVFMPAVAVIAAAFPKLRWFSYGAWELKITRGESDSTSDLKGLLVEYDV